MSFSIKFAWRDLRASGHTLWVFCVCLMLGVTLVAATGGLYRQVSGENRGQTTVPFETVVCPLFSHAAARKGVVRNG